MGDQIFNYDASFSSFVLTPNGFEDFFDVHAAIESAVTCQLLANDCAGTLVGTQADGMSSLTGGPHITMDSWRMINGAKNVATGFQYDACVKCQYNSITPS